MGDRRLILIEFNELCPSLLRRFMTDGHIPNFQRFYESSMVFTTDAGEDSANLEPWIQWLTVHSGMPYSEHRVDHLGDGRFLHQKCLAELLSDNGIPVGVFGSMNVNYKRLHGYFMPDPWDRSGQPHPESLHPYCDFVMDQVQESSREQGPLSPRTLSFSHFMARNGLSAGTIRSVASHLLAELRDPGVRWRRPVLLDQIQYDVFRKLNGRFGVKFATFFSNSTAHFQHYYWRNMSPELFSTSPPDSDHASLGSAILYGYRAMDRLLGRFQQDYGDSHLILCTALSQQPWTDTMKVTFRPRNFEALLEFAGVASANISVKPVMAEQFHLDCSDERQAEALEAALKSLTVGGTQLMHLRRSDASLFTGCRINDSDALSWTVERQDGAKRPFRSLFYMIHGPRSGRHHPDGALWIRNGQHRDMGRVPLTVIAPTILAHFGVPQPSHMHGEALGL